VGARASAGQRRLPVGQRDIGESLVDGVIPADGELLDDAGDSLSAPGPILTCSSSLRMCRAFRVGDHRVLAPSFNRGRLRGEPTPVLRAAVSGPSLRGL